MSYTLGEMRTSLALGLGRGQGAGSAAQMLRTFLIDAQNELNDSYDFPSLRATWDVVLGEDDSSIPWNSVSFTADGGLNMNGSGETLINVIDPNRITGVFVAEGERWRPLEEGIEYIHDKTGSVPLNASIPRRYERAQSLEFWPTADQDYTIRVEGYARLSAFSDDDDVVTLDRQLVYLYALSNAKAHYGQKDHASVVSRFQKRLNIVRAQAHGNNRYIPGKKEIVVLKPVIV